MRNYYNIEKDKWELIKVYLPVDKNGKEIILIPNELVVENLNFNTMQFISLMVLPPLQNNAVEQGLSKPTKADLKREARLKYPNRHGYKTYALDEAKKNPNLVNQYFYILENYR